MSSGYLTHRGQPARVEAMTPGADVLPLAITRACLPVLTASRPVAVVRRADANLVPVTSTPGKSASATGATRSWP